MICIKCKKSRKITSFRKNNCRKNGLQVYCHFCMDVIHKEYNKSIKGIENRKKYQNGDKYRNYQKEYQRLYEKTEKRKLYKLKYNKLKKTKLLVRKNKRIYTMNRRMNDPYYRLNNSIGSAISRSLKGKKHGEKWEKIIGYNLGDLIKHLESQFDNNMSWDNYGSYWSIDHIKPRAAFFYQSPEDDSFKDCWKLNNLRPLEKIENIRKSNKFEQEYEY